MEWEEDMNINWDEKPDWADVWLESCSEPVESGWCVSCGDFWQFVDERTWPDNKHWHKKYEKNGEYKIYYPPETKPEWNGEGIPPVGLSVEVFHNGRWIGATTVGEFGDHKKCMVCAPDGGGFYGFYLNEIRPIKSDKEKWVEQASTSFHKNSLVDYSGQPFLHGLDGIYDALISGELPIPKGANND